MKIYLAGPQVFLPDPGPIFKQKKVLCESFGFEGVSPFDSETDYGFRPNIECGLSFSESNEELMKKCDCIIADLTPFRGISLDPGTAFEIGYMRARGKPCYGYSNTKRNFFGRCYLHYKDKVQASVDVDDHGMKFENFDMVDNLMIHGAIIRSNGCTFICDAPENELYTSLTAFEKVLEHIKKKRLA
jgi:nucleoside 2-deoxyribosyltransferase